MNTSALPPAIIRAATLIGSARYLTVLTGAGISKESGVPTFRDALDGLWARYDPQQLATPDAFRADPGLVWRWYADRHRLIEAVQPNPAHYALVELEEIVPQVVVITQNIDGLHRRAGSTEVVALHGNIHEFKCSADCQGDPTLVDVPNWADLSEPPPCPHCGALLRPNIIWFGEPLPTVALERAVEAAQLAEVMLVIGTSGLVSPAAQLPALAKDSGAVLIDLNSARDSITTIADLFIQEAAGIALPMIVQAMR